MDSNIYNQSNDDILKFPVSVPIDRDIVGKVTFSIGYFACYIPKIIVVILSCRLFAIEIICMFLLFLIVTVILKSQFHVIF